jgi:hypothetical protein
MVVPERHQTNSLWNYSPFRARPKDLQPLSSEGANNACARER